MSNVHLMSWSNNNNHLERASIITYIHKKGKFLPMCVCKECAARVLIHKVETNISHISRGVNFSPQRTILHNVQYSRWCRNYSVPLPKPSITSKSPTFKVLL